MTDDLSTIAARHETDKGPWGHDYTPLYDAILGPSRNDVRRVLEIGIFKGGSLKMWSDYFPNALVVGIDITDCRAMFEGYPRIRALHGDALDPAIIAVAGQLFANQGDLIVDDGSHFTEEVKDAFEAYFPMLRKGGFYVVEDMSPREAGEGFWLMRKR